MARLGAKMVSERSFVHPKKHVFGRNFLNKPAHTSFLGLTGYMVRSGAKLFRTKTLLNFASKSLLKFLFPKNTFSVWIFVLNHTSPNLWAKRFRWRGCGQKWSRSEVSSFPKNTFSIGIFSRNRPHTSFLGLIGYMVRSGAKLFRTKT